MEIKKYIKKNINVSSPRISVSGCQFERHKLSERTRIIMHFQCGVIHVDRTMPTSHNSKTALSVVLSSDENGQSESLRSVNSVGHDYPE